MSLTVADDEARHGEMRHGQNDPDFVPTAVNHTGKRDDANRSVKMQKESEEVLPTPTDEGEEMEDCDGMPVFNLHVEGRWDEPIAIKQEPVEESSSASTSESWDCANADDPYFSHEHANVGQTTLVLAKKGKLLLCHYSSRFVGCAVEDSIVGEGLKAH
ncbi:zinc finger protein 510 isoform X1 [Ixodes scapularis]